MTQDESERRSRPKTIRQGEERLAGSAEHAQRDKYSGYDRTRDLPKIIALWPMELRDFSPEGTRKIIGRLQNALRAERGRGRSGHWSYDLDRHLALVRAYKSETATLEQCAGGYHITA